MPDIRLDRTFWPVGHGAFYTERFYDYENGHTFTAVYDCGGKGALREDENGKSQSYLFMHDKVKEFIGRKSHREEPCVDLLFISHLHRDHINGVPDLLPYVKRIVLPQLEEEAYVEAFMYNAITSDDGVLDVNSALQSFIVRLANDGQGIDARITRVRPNNNDKPNTDHPEEILTPEQLGSLIGSGTPIHVPPTIYHKGKPFWIYIPVNLSIKTDKEDSLSDVLCSKLGKNLKDANGKINWDALQDALRQADIASIKKIYEGYFDIKHSEHNFYSMPVFSGPVIGVPQGWYIDTNVYDDEWYDKFHWSPYRWHLPHNEKFLSCLYMGDFEAKKPGNMAALIAELKDYYYRAGLQQVPHHYSRRNHNRNLYVHRLLAFGNVDDHKDVSYCHSIFREIRDSMFLPPLVITEKDVRKEIIYEMYC